MERSHFYYNLFLLFTFTIPNCGLSIYYLIFFKTGNDKEITVLDIDSISLLYKSYPENCGLNWIEGL